MRTDGSASRENPPMENYLKKKKREMILKKAKQGNH